MEQKLTSQQIELAMGEIYLKAGAIENLSINASAETSNVALIDAMHTSIQSMAQSIALIADLVIRGVDGIPMCRSSASQLMPPLFFKQDGEPSQDVPLINRNLREDPNRS